MEKKRYILLAIILGCQIGLFALLKFYFFEKLSDGLAPDSTNNTGIINNGTNNNTASNGTNSTLLFY